MKMQQKHSQRSSTLSTRATPCYSQDASFGLVSFWAASLLLGLMPGWGSAAEQPKVENHTQTFSVKLGATRVIYDPSSSGTTLTVTNPQDYPILVQSQALAENMKDKAPFVVTPPLFRLDGQQQSRLRIVRTGGNFPDDRESIQWLCVKGVPPKADDVWSKDENGKAVANNTVSLNVRISINSCIKLFVRPGSVKGHPSDVAGSLGWQRVGDKIKATNSTPFYINLTSVSVNGAKLKEALHYVPPFSSYEFALPKGISGAGKVQWTIINDYGGESKLFSASF